MHKLTLSIDHREISIYGVNAVIMEWLKDSSLANDFFSGVEHLPDLLYLALGAPNEADRIRASKAIINSLWQKYRQLGPYPFLETLSEFEFDRIFFPGYRDHVSHQLKVLLLGLYLYDRCDVLRQSINHEIQRDCTSEPKAEFLLRWLVTSVYHDIGYVLENEQANEATGTAWRKTRDAMNKVFSAPLSSMPQLKSKLSEESETKALQKNKQWHLQVNYAKDIETDGDNDLLRLIADYGIRAGLTSEEEANPFRCYYDYAFTHSTASNTRPRFRDHGIASALLLLRTWLYFSDYVQRLTDFASDPLLKQVASEVVSLARTTPETKKAILAAAGSIALHNINKDIWHQGDALASGLTLDQFSIRLTTEASTPSSQGGTPLAFLLALVDTLQDWDRSRFRAPRADDKSIMLDQDIVITADQEHLFLFFPQDEERFRNPQKDPDSIYSKACFALNSHLESSIISNLVRWKSPRAVEEEAQIGQRESKRKESKIIRRASQSTSTSTEPNLARPEPSPPAPDHEELLKVIEERHWIIGAVNFDEDLHFSSFYLRNSMAYQMPKNLKEYGYEHIIAIYKDFNEVYYVPENECRVVAESLLHTVIRNPLWLQDILDDIQRKAQDLYEVFPFKDEFLPFSNLPEYDLLRYYRRHNEAHMRLYESARIPEALDRGLNIFTDYLKDYLRKRGAEFVSHRALNRVFELMTFPEKMSVAGQELVEFFKLLDTIKSEDSHRKAFSGSTRRIFLRAHPRLLADIQEYRNKWIYWGYHGYGTRALRDMNYFLERLRRELARAEPVTRERRIFEAFESAEISRLETYERYKVDATHQMLFRLHSRIGTTKLYRRYIQLRNFYFLDQLLAEIARRRMLREEVVRSLLPEELELIITGTTQISAEQEQRTQGIAFSLCSGKERIFTGDSVEEISTALQAATSHPPATDNKLFGTPVSSGVARGRTRVVIRPEDDSAINFQRGDILISESTDPDLIELIKQAGGVATQSGGVTSHASIVCRELRVPAIVGVSDLLNRIKDGDQVVLNADEGLLIVAQPSESRFALFEPDILNHSEVEVGNKARTLVKLGNSGIRVPRFFVVPWQYISAIDYHGTPDALNPVMQQLSTDVQEALQYVGGELFALRSSTLEEDRDDTSGAGTQNSELHVAREDVVSTLVQFGSDAPYDEEDEPKGSLIIQEMILGDISGVLLSADPLNGDRQKILIEVVPGGNELLTAGQVIPARYTIDRHTRSVVNIENHEQWAGLLDPGMVEKLVHHAERIEAILGSSQDIEWTVKEDDVWILQSRPMTGLLSGPSDKIRDYQSSRRPRQRVRDIASIYRAYRIPPNLQRHMLQVAGIGAWLLDRWKGPELESREILETLLLHDIGNLAKADYLKVPFLFPEDLGHVEYWKAVQSWLKRRYGQTDHEVTLNIAREIGLSDRVLYLLANKQFILNRETLASKDLALKVCAYCDQRVSPRGILPIRARLSEAIYRYRGLDKASVNHPDRERLVECAVEIEKQVFEYVDGTPSDIHDDAVERYIPSLRSFELSSPYADAVTVAPQDLKTHIIEKTADQGS